MAMEITDVAYFDHGVSEDIVRMLELKYKDRNGFFIETFPLQEVYGKVMCGLHGPAMGDNPILEEEVTMEVRGECAGPSRMCERAPRETHVITVIAGPYDGKDCVLYQVLGGPSTPREPFDSRELDEDQFFESCEFWSKHALSLEGSV